MSSVKKHYGFSAISRSLRPFLIGKGFRLVTSLTILVLLARFLPQKQYAVYISLQALVTIAGALSSVGIQQVMLRYMPELRAAGNNSAMYRMLSVGMFLRVVVVSLFMLLAWPLTGWLGETFSIEQWLWVLPWYALVGLLRLTAMSLSQSLEALLWQKQAQYSMAIGGMARLVGMLIALQLGVMDLWAIVIIELCSEGLSLALLLYGWFTQRSSDELRQEGSLDWWSENKPRVFRFGAWSGLLNQTRILYGSAPNRLFAAHYLGTAELAVLGFADSLTNLARRLMPARMLISMIRPVFMANYSSNQDFGQLVKMSNLVYRLNAGLLALPIVLLFVVGEPIFDWLTGGKYGMAAPILAGFLALMIVEGMRSMLELLVQAVEKNQILLTNLIQSVSLFLAIPLFEYVGLWALVIVNIVGTVSANFAIIYLLKKYDFHYRVDVGLSLLIMVYAVIAGLAGWWMLQTFGSYILSAVTIVMVYLLCMLVRLPLFDDEKEKLKLLMKNQFKSAKKAAA
ncbi:MAG: lipopolysaccharide biosynthesis protein [Gammaproteobacteria bacterium]